MRDVSGYRTSMVVQGGTGSVHAIASSSTTTMAVGSGPDGAQVIATSDGSHFHQRTSPAHDVLRAVLPVAGDHFMVAGDHGAIFETRDAGASWSKRTATTSERLLAMAQQRDGTMWIGGSGGFLSWSRSRGETWTPIHPRMPGDVHGLLALDSRLLVYGKGFAGWVTTELSLFPFAASHVLNTALCTTSGTLFLAGNGGAMFRSVDRGRSWQSIQTPVALDLYTMASLPQGILAGGARGVMLWADPRGERFESAPSGVSCTVSGFADTDSGVFLGLEDGGIARVAFGQRVVSNHRRDTFAARRQLDECFTESTPETFLDSAFQDCVVSRASDRRPQRSRRATKHTLEFHSIWGAEEPWQLRELRRTLAKADTASLFDWRLAIDPLEPPRNEQNLFAFLIEEAQRTPERERLTAALSGLLPLGFLEDGTQVLAEAVPEDMDPRVVGHKGDHFRIFARDLSSFVYLAALCEADRTSSISDDTFSLGCKRLRGLVAPPRSFMRSVRKANLSYWDSYAGGTGHLRLCLRRSQWVRDLLSAVSPRDTERAVDRIDARMLRTASQHQLALDLETARLSPSLAVYCLWRSYFVTPQRVHLPVFIEMATSHPARLVRDCAQLVSTLASGERLTGQLSDLRQTQRRFETLLSQRGLMREAPQRRTPPPVPRTRKR